MSELEKAMNFSKKVSIPDVGERTDNDPVYLMSSNDVFKLVCSVYSQGPNVEKRDIRLFQVKSIIAKAKEMGWSDIQLHGKQLLFIK